MLDAQLQNRLDVIGRLIDEVCHDHLTDEYAGLARAAAERLAALPEVPLLGGKAEGWACGLVRAVGYVNFLSDPASVPHLRTADLAPLFGVSEATAGNRERAVRDLLDLVRLDPHWTLPSRLENNPMAWTLLVQGLPVDARTLPGEAQAALAEAGYIPFAPSVPGARPPQPRWQEAEADADAGAADPRALLDPDAPRLRLRITLEDVEPEVMREVEVPSDLPLDGLHEVIQAAMGWEGAHLHVFEGPRARTWGPVFEAGVDWDDECAVTIAEVLPRTGSRLTYTYDLGDEWRHVVQRVAAMPAPTGGWTGDTQVFVCTDGRGACPPEDCGGPWGYAELLEALADASHPEHEELLAWIGGAFDPHAFRVEEAQRRLNGEA